MGPSWKTITTAVAIPRELGGWGSQSQKKCKDTDFSSALNIRRASSATLELLVLHV